MKIAKLFVLGALLLMGNSVMAEIVDGVRQQPKPKTVGFQAEEEYYLYNVDAAQFFTQGNAYGTQASTSIGSGLKVKFVKYTQESSEWDGKTYLFNDYRNNAWFYVFFDSETGLYVDLGNQTDKNPGWEVEENGGGTFLLSASETVPTNIPNKSQTFTGGLTKQEGKYVGLDLSKDASNTALHPFLAPGEGVCLNWAFVAVEEYEALASQLELYVASVPLKEVLDKAKAIGADVAAQEAVYLNESSTVEQLNKAVEDVKTAITKREKELAEEGIKTATAENPVDVTILYVTNPDFAGNDGKTGWSGTEFGAVNAKDNAEHYAKNYDTYQTIKDLPAGVYAVGVNAFYRAGNPEPAYENYKAANADSRNAKLYAATTTDTLMASIVSPFVGAPTAKVGVGNESEVKDGEVSYWIPNNMEAAEYYMHTLGLYANSVFNAVEDGTLTLGVRKDVTIGGDWTIFDDFSLTYYGNGADAYQMWFDVALPELDIYTGVELPKNHTAKYVEDYTSTFAKLNGQKVSNREETMVAIQDAKDAAEAITLNISLWAQFEALIEEALAVSTNSDLDVAYTGPLNVWARRDAPLALQKLEMTNEELQAEVDRITKAIDEARKHPAGDNVDMTNMLTNPGFENGTTGWTIYNPTGGVAAHGGTDTNKCFEAWNNSNFDIYQVVKNAPKGIYAISVQGFYRYMRDASGYNAYQAQEVDEVKPGKAPVYIYMNDNQTSFTNIYGDPIQITDPDFYVPQSSNNRQEVVDEATGITYYYPNNMSDAAIAFANNMYTQSAYGVVANDGDEMRIGVKGNTSQKGDSWCIWDNFKLTFMGFDNKDVVEPILKTTLESTKDLVNSPMPNSVKAVLETSRANADAALASGNGVDMFNALSALLTANSAANTSIALYAQVQAALEKLADALNVSESTDEVYYAADDLYKDIDDAMQSGEMEDSDVEKALEDIAYWIKQLKVPADLVEASDANPKDCTYFIENPDYASMNNDGWTIEGANPGFNEASNGLIEVWNSNFDEYQEFDYLPAGTYAVSVQGFYRYGSTQNEYDTYTANPDENNYLTLYAVVGDNEYAAAMPRLASDGAEEHTSTRFTDNEETGVRTFDAGDDLLEGDAWQWKWMTEPEIAEDSLSATGIRIANGMIPAANLFSEGKFTGPELFFTVGDDGKARIGLKKQEATNTYDSWCIWDNWKLTYYGSKSKNDPTAIEDVADKTAVVKREFFNVSGARVNSTAKGIVIVKETLSNGAVKVKKVTVK